MKNVFCFIFVSILFVSCKVANVTKDSMIGIYTATGKDYSYQLSLKNNNEFVLKFKSMETKSGCEGKWEFKNSDLIILDCNEPKDVAETLQGGYMSNRHMEVKIKCKDKIILNNVVLKKQE
ncbi:hypothetical protein [Flavobacterium sp. GCM10023249]|uniref:hypothetical protein n=1 Tax=unclassified Flavobacterium TaxID=196869 RepID=UPI00360DD985